MMETIAGKPNIAVQLCECRRPKGIVRSLFVAVLLFMVPLTVLAGSTPHQSGPGSAIQVEITTHLGDGQSFVQGDTLAFFLSLDQDAHIVAIYEDAQHRRIQIVPNANQKNSFYPSGLFNPIPAEDAGFRFTVAPPYGRERLWVFASRAPIEVLSGELLANGLKQLHADIPTIKRRIQAQAGPAFGEFCLSLQTLSDP